jgi:hypothetical protein
MAEEGARTDRTGAAPLDVPREVRILMERMEEAAEAIERLENRANTLVRLVDLLGRRVDRLEATR